MALCFVLMPFGRKPAAGGTTIDFDAVWQDLIRPAVLEAGLEPIRADEEQAGGIIHKPMFERLVLCEYAVADLTTANPNVLYELGVRHGIRPFSTILLFSAGAGPLPFDVALLRGLPYALGLDGRPSNIDQDRAALSQRLLQARDASADSPLFQLLEGFPDIARLRTDVFREQVTYSTKVKDALRAARASGADAVAAVEAELLQRHQGMADVDAGIAVDLMLSYRAVKDWPRMIALIGRMSRPLAETTMVREQLGFALNRAGRSEDAEQVLATLIREKGASSETCGLLGRVYKDRWEKAVQAGSHVLAKGWLKRAIDAYLQGFEADWRDAYPGVNAVTLMELAEPPDPRRLRLIEVVAYAVDRRIAAGKPDYWDHATRLELSVLRLDEAAASEALQDALAAVREKWEPETTLRNLELIAAARQRRGVAVEWVGPIHQELASAARP